MLRVNDVVNVICSWKVLKFLLLSEIFDIEFYKLKWLNEIERVIIKEIWEEVI